MCVQCGKTFTRTSSAVRAAIKRGRSIKYCSKKCASDYRGRKRVERTCVICGKKFLTQKQRASTENVTCSPVCANKKRILNNIGENVTLTCKECGKKFIKKASYVRKQEKRGQPVRFCSKKCAYKFKTFLKRKKTYCAYCGKELERLASKTISFCNIECKQAYFKNLHDHKICPVCGKHFEVVSSVKNIRVCCSKECREKLRRTIKDTYEKLSHYLRSHSKYAQWRKNVANKSKYICERCGKKVNGDLQIHHKKSLYSICHKYGFDIEAILNSHEFNDVNNGECLCRECHIKQHPYDLRLHNKKGQYCRREFKTT